LSQDRITPPGSGIARWRQPWTQTEIRFGREVITSGIGDLVAKITAVPAAPMKDRPKPTLETAGFFCFLKVSHPMNPSIPN
jgi:hypothetical protein